MPSRVERLANSTNPYIRAKAWKKWEESGAVGSINTATISIKKPSCLHHPDTSIYAWGLDRLPEDRFLVVLKQTWERGYAALLETNTNPKSGADRLFLTRYLKAYPNTRYANKIKGHLALSL